MDSFFRSDHRSGWSYESFKNFRHVTPNVQQHLKLVYLTLGAALLASAFGVYLHILWNIGGTLTFLGCAGSMFWMLATPVYQERTRLGLLMSAALLEGATVGPLIKLGLQFDLSLVLTAFVGTAVAFACFSVAALVAKRQEYIYLGGLLSSGLSILLWLRFASSLFGDSVAMFNAEIYFGLLVFLGYIVFDTQMMIERAYSGDLDYVKHALELFTDFIAVIVRVLIIMLKNKSAKSEGKRKKKSN